MYNDVETIIMLPHGKTDFSSPSAQHQFQGVSIAFLQTLCYFAFTWVSFLWSEK